MSEASQLLRRVRLALQNQDYQEAIRCLEQAADIARSMGDISTEGRHLGNLALIYHRLGQAEKALEYSELALARARAEHDRATENGLLGNIGNILRELKRYDDALNYLNQALVIAQELGDMRGRGIWLGNLGLLYDDLNQPARAAELHEQAAAIARQLQDHRGLITRLVNLSSSYAEMGVLPDAVKALQEAAALCAELGDIASLATRLMQLGDLQVELAHTIKQRSEARQLLQLALENYKQALDTTQALGSGTGHGIDQIKLMQAKLLYAIGCVLGELGQQERAIECFDVAARFFASLGMQEARAEVERRRELVLAG